MNAEIRDPRINPIPGDVLHKWDRNFLVTRHEMGCVFTEPSLSAHQKWTGLLFYREWAAHSEVVYAECAPTK